MFYFSTAKVILNCLFSALSVRFWDSTYTGLRKKGPYSEILWSVFSRICTECGKILCIPPYSVQMLENTNQINIKYGHFSHSAYHSITLPLLETQEKFSQDKTRFDQKFLLQ